MSQRPLAELLQVDDPAWPVIQGWIANAHIPVEVLPAERTHGERVLLALQVTTRSPLGAFALETGGVLVDHGWLRLLGCGHQRMPDSLLTWNGLAEPSMGAPVNGGFVVAVDVLGGVFGLNSGGLGPKPGIYYFAPESLQWESLGAPHMGFVEWAFLGDLAQFYGSVRWPGWEDEVAALEPGYGISVYPFLWTAGASVVERARRAVPLAELWRLERDLARQVAELPEETPIRLHFSYANPDGASE
jgi:hypothetical protein